MKIILLLSLFFSIGLYSNEKIPNSSQKEMPYKETPKKMAPKKQTPKTLPDNKREEQPKDK